MAIVIMALFCGTGITVTLLNMVNGHFKRRTQAPPALADEMRALREEIRQLRQQNNDVILTLDNTVQRLDQRVSYVEARTSLGSGNASEAETPQLMSRR